MGARQESSDGLGWAGVWKQLKPASPVFLLLIFSAFSVFCFYLGYTRNLDDVAGVRWQTIWYSIGSSVLSGSVFGVLLKSIQFLGVFERALANIVLANKSWLASLSEQRLKNLWEDTTAAIVVKGFPDLSANLTKDVLDQMVPKLGQFYYSRIKRRVELRSYDPEKDELEVCEEYHLVMHAHEDEEITYSFSSSYAAAATNTDEKIISFFQIDGEDYLEEVKYQPTTSEKLYDYEVSYCIKLKGKEQYSVKRHMRRTTQVSKDPVWHMVTQRFVTSMEVTVDNRCSEHFRIRALPLGIAEGGCTISQDSDTITVIEVNRLMFPGDGLLIVYERS